MDISAKPIENEVKHSTEVDAKSPRKIRHPAEAGARSPREEIRQPETPPYIEQRIDKGYTRKADRIGKPLMKPDGCEYLPCGTSIMDLPKKERKKYMWLVPDELKNNPMYDKEPEECKTDICKMKREEREDNERKEKKRFKDQEDTIQLLMVSMADLIKQVNVLSSKK